MAHGTCVVCGDPLTGRQRLLCSRACQTKRLMASDAYQQAQARRDPATKYRMFDHICITCREPWQSQKPDGKFCSYTCRDLWFMEHPRRKREPKLCHLPSDHPARWLGSSSALHYSTCLGCDALLCSPEWNQKAWCSKRCRSRMKSREKSGRRQLRHKGRRQAIIERDGYLCWLCGDPCDRTVTAPHPLSPTVDHVVPRSLGGDDTPENLACAHFICNSRRGASVERLTLPSPLAA